MKLCAYKYDEHSSLKECYEKSYFRRIRTIEKHLDEKSELLETSVNQVILSPMKEILKR